MPADCKQISLVSNMPAGFTLYMAARRCTPIPTLRNALLSVAIGDLIAASLRRIETLAALLRALSVRVPCEPLDGEMVGEAAGMISDETIRIRTALDSHGKARK